MKVARVVLKDSPDLVVLAGWMHILGAGFLEFADGMRPFEDGTSKPAHVINLHPALPGARMLSRGLMRRSRGVRLCIQGVMMHRVVKDVDRGQPLIVKEVEMTMGEPIKALEA